jgi:RNA polymerase sigma factor (sigma-70 family)
MVKDHARAEDLTQDVFVSALRRMRDTDRPIAFKPWIYEIAKNACIDQFRRSRRAEEVSYDADEGLGAADYGRLVSADARPEDRLESKQSLDHLRGAFGGLSEAHHQILVMRELEGLSYREIGERLGMTRPSVESTLFRARRRLTEEYEELVSGARCQRIQAIISGAADADLGARDNRRLARHVSHCQPCRRQARVAGLEIPVTADHPVRQRIAVLFPLPLFLRRRWAGDGGGDASAVGPSHLSSFAQWSAQLGSTVDPSWIKAAATAATVALAGAGAGLAGRSSTPTSPAGDLRQVVASIGGSDAAGPGRLEAGTATTLQHVARTVTAATTVVTTRTEAAESPSSTTPTPAGSSQTAGANAGAGIDDGLGQVASGLSASSGSPPPNGGRPHGSGSSGSGGSPQTLAPARVTVPGGPPLATSIPDAGSVAAGAGTAANGAVTTATGALSGGG